MSDIDSAASVLTMSASEFKAKCLDVFARLASGSLERVVVTKRGKTVAIVTPAQRAAESVEQIFGCMRGSVIIPQGLDLTAPTSDIADFDAARGVLREQ